MTTVLILATLVLPALGGRMPYIVGGRNADYPGKWPWQASLQSNQHHSCGAVLVSSRWLVTAAHCVGGSQAQYSIVLGMHDRVAMSQGQPRRYDIKQIISHPDWNNDARYSFPHDIAVVELASDADLSSRYVSTIQMASSGQSFVGSTCYITGWGLLGPNKGLADVLQEAEVDVYTNGDCRKSWSNIADFQICVGKHGEASSCSSDSGGPLACKTGNTWTLAGVTSYGVYDCSTLWPSVYTRISYYRDWIRKHTGV